MTTLQAGPLLAGILAAQERDDVILRYPTIEAVANAVITVANRLGSPVLWPVGAAANRLVGAVEALAGGTVTAVGRNHAVHGKDVLLVATAALSSLELAASARQARLAGAASVHACALDRLRIESRDGLDSFHALDIGIAIARRSA